MNTVCTDDFLLKMLRNASLREQGFRELMRKYGRALYWHVRRIVVGHDDAEDAVQETCIKIYDKIEGFDGDAKRLKSWIYKIATNEALQILRRQTGIFQSIDSLGDTLTQKLQAESEIDGTAAEMLFQKALLQLPTRQRIVFNMRYYDEMSYEQIAEITGSKTGTLKTNYHYAAEKIKEYIKQNSPE